mgnify:CR=1 FL=1
MKTMNKIIITGNLCKDIELRYTNSKIAVLQNTVAVKNDFKNADGEYDSEFINIVVWRQTAEFLNNYAAKGSKVLVEGRLTNRSYDKQDGTKGYITEVVAEKVELLDAKKKENASNVKQDAPVQEESVQSDPFKDFSSEIVLTDDDLPF